MSIRQIQGGTERFIAGTLAVGDGSEILYRRVKDEGTITNQNVTGLTVTDGGSAVVVTRAIEVTVSHINSNTYYRIFTNAGTAWTDRLYLSTNLTTPLHTRIITT